MQTIYYTTQNYIRHTGNVVDLAQYRARLGLAREGSAPADRPQAGEDAPRHPLRRRPTRRGVGLTLDACATLAIVIMAITVMAKWMALV